jgi:predicted site-specific integrase-resolvase
MSVVENISAESVVQPIFCRTTRAKKVFDVSITTLYRWAAKGHIKIHKRSGMSFVRIKEVEDYIANTME